MTILCLVRNCLWFIWGIGIAASFVSAQSPTNLVTNGTFELDASQDGVPDFWQAAGDRETRQELGREALPEGGFCARLVCTQMGKDSPSAHAMICQVGRVAVQRGQWYRLTFRAKAEGIPRGVSVALNNIKTWKNAGLDHGFYAMPQWQKFEFVFEATADLPADNSRLQFWFKSTGALWLDDVEMVAIPGGRQWHPQWPHEGVVNLVPNGAFECGAANWGSYNNEPGGWGNQLYQLVGEWQPSGGADGGGCLKIAWAPESAPVFYFDYFQAVRRPVRRIQATNLGWLTVTPGEPMQFSAEMRSEPAGIPATLTVVQAEGPTRQQTVRLTQNWQRYSLSFRPERPFVFVAAGPDYLNSTGPAGVVWIDRVALYRQKDEVPYQTRQAMESFLELPATGNIFTNPAAGLTVTIRAASHGAPAKRLEGRLRITDFYDRVVWEESLAIQLTDQTSPHFSRGAQTLTGLLTNRLGYYRVQWITAQGTNSQRCALIEPVAHADGGIGMNHAYPWDFLVHLAHLAGIRWWRDWSAKWHEVEKTQGQWEFQVPEEQIARVLRLGGQPLILLPFPSSWWSSRMAAQAGGAEMPPAQDYEKLRRYVAQAPQRWEDFGAYAAAVARHFQGRATAYHILNEPIYTSYSLPRADGYTMADYLKILEIAYTRIKAVSPQARVVGGIGTGPEAGLTLEFVEQGGLRYADILDLHLYEPPAPTENQEHSYAALKALMERHGGSKPIWITEYGCYADDDPACIPPRTGDSAMTRSRWPSEQAAAEHLVKYTAITFTYGVRKIFLHAGSAAQINGPNEGGIFFEYGGQPRKMYVAVAALNRLLGTPDESLGTLTQGAARVFLFRRGNQTVGLAWSSEPILISLPQGIRACDILGNPLSEGRFALTGAPVYLQENVPDARQLRALFGQGAAQR